MDYEMQKIWLWACAKAIAKKRHMNHWALMTAAECGGRSLSDQRRFLLAMWRWV